MKNIRIGFFGVASPSGLAKFVLFTSKDHVPFLHGNMKDIIDRLVHFGMYVLFSIR